MIKKVWDELNWPQVAFLGMVIAGIVVTFLNVPLDFWASIDWRWWAGFLLAGGGVTGSAFAGKLFGGAK